MTCGKGEGQACRDCAYVGYHCGQCGCCVPLAETDEIAARPWDDDPNHPEGWDCDGYPLSSGERCGNREHKPYGTSAERTAP